MGKIAVAVGSLIGVRNILDAEHWLGLVVDQEAGKKWVDRDPCIEFSPSECGHLLVRILGEKLTEASALYKSSLPQEEPRVREVVRWAFVQTSPPQFFFVAGPDPTSISRFLDQCRVTDGLGMRGGTFFFELEILIEYLLGVTEKKTEKEMGAFEKKFFEMLKEVLPH